MVQMKDEDDDVIDVYDVNDYRQQLLMAVVVEQDDVAVALDVVSLIAAIATAVDDDVDGRRLVIIDGDIVTLLEPIFEEEKVNASTLTTDDDDVKDLVIELDDDELPGKNFGKLFDIDDDDKRELNLLPPPPFTKPTELDDDGSAVGIELEEFTIEAAGDGGRGANEELVEGDVISGNILERLKFVAVDRFDDLLLFDLDVDRVTELLFD
ncbi:hypothetical protein DERF_005701 [Dermatophagoides farinae]|uniref:Uncharacterized protein n=1 Tax=Dermatophagoides farinae TaxID=6954 RepID=A0A922L7E4_DERFA|nr:hypothetical protein DERF_005701 [Dermatophagoides farinae]